MPECINLMDRFGTKYKIGWDECYDPKGRPKENLDTWYMIVPCERGMIYPHGDTKLSVTVDYRLITAERLVESGVCELYQDGDHEKTFLFDAADFDTVSEIVKQRRKRWLTAEHRDRNIERLREYRFDSRMSERSLRAPTQSERLTRARFCKTTLPMPDDGPFRPDQVAGPFDVCHTKTSRSGDVSHRRRPVV